MSPRGLCRGMVAALSLLALAVPQADAANRSFSVKAPAEVIAGAGFDVAVKAKKGSKIDTDFKKKVTLGSSDGGADLPQPYKFKSSDHGRHTFHNVRLVALGEQEIAASSGSTVGSRNVSVAELTCPGESYDVNGDPDDGCEANQELPNRTTQPSAHFLGNTDDCSDQQDPVSISGTLLSDTREHVGPSVPDFNAGVGSAPAWYTTNVADTTVCDEFYELSVHTLTAPATQCYQFTVSWRIDGTSETGFETVALSGANFAVIDGEWDGSEVDDSARFWFEFEKTCSSASVAEAVDYEIRYAF